jgi:hypothetical protein
MAKWPGHEANHSTPSSASAANQWSYSSTSPIHFHPCTGILFDFTPEKWWYNSIASLQQIVRKKSSSWPTAILECFIVTSVAKKLPVPEQLGSSLPSIQNLTVRSQQQATNVQRTVLLQKQLINHSFFYVFRISATVFPWFSLWTLLRETNALHIFIPYLYTCLISSSISTWVP